METEKRLNHPVDEWQWFGQAAHFICGRWCRFHLATKVGPWLISTVGEYVHPRHGGGAEKGELVWLKENWPGEEIGAGRHYETMVFEAGALCERDECGCGLPEIGSGEIDMEGYSTAGEATKGHLALCFKYANLSTEEVL